MDHGSTELGHCVCQECGGQGGVQPPTDFAWAGSPWSDVVGWTGAATCSTTHACTSGGGFVTFSLWWPSPKQRKGPLCGAGLAFWCRSNALPRSKESLDEHYTCMPLAMLLPLNSLLPPALVLLLPHTTTTPVAPPEAPPQPYCCTCTWPVTTDGVVCTRSRSWCGVGPCRHRPAKGGGSEK